MTIRTLCIRGAIGVLVIATIHAASADTQDSPTGRAVLDESPSGPRTVWNGVFTESQAERGGAVYAQECANCHGSGLEGADMSPALVGSGFLSNWNDLTVGDLFERIRISMPADRPGTLSRAQNADVIAHMLQVNGFPMGAAELPTEAPALKDIRILTVKPQARLRKRSEADLVSSMSRGGH